MNTENKVNAVSLGIGFQFNNDIQIESSELFVSTNADSVKIKHLNENYVLEKNHSFGILLMEKFTFRKSCFFSEKAARFF